MAVKNIKKEQQRNERYLHRVIAALLVLFVFLGIGVWRLPTQMTVYQPPDISKAFSQKVDEVPPHAVYNFARALWETLNFCDKDCGQEYPNSIEKYRNYLTSSCQHDLLANFDSNRNLYSYRTRRLLPTDATFFDTDDIKQTSADTWFIYLNYRLHEEVHGAPTRDVLIRYPLKIVKSSRPLGTNPIGLEVDCYFGEGPIRTETEEKS